MKRRQFFSLFLAFVSGVNASGIVISILEQDAFFSALRTCWACFFAIMAYLNSEMSE